MSRKRKPPDCDENKTPLFLPPSLKAAADKAGIFVWDNERPIVATKPIPVSVRELPKKRRKG